MSARTPEVVKTNWAWSPIYNILEMLNIVVKIKKSC